MKKSDINSDCKVIDLEPGYGLKSIDVLPCLENIVDDSTSHITASVIPPAVEYFHAWKGSFGTHYYANIVRIDGVKFGKLGYLKRDDSSDNKIYIDKIMVSHAPSIFLSEKGKYKRPTISAMKNKDRVYEKINTDTSYDLIASVLSSNDKGHCGAYTLTNDKTPKIFIHVDIAGKVDNKDYYDSFEFELASLDQSTFEGRCEDREVDDGHGSTRETYVSSSKFDINVLASQFPKSSNGETYVVGKTGDYISLDKDTPI